MNDAGFRPLVIPNGYRGVVADTDFLGHLAVMEKLSLPAGAQRPWKRAVVIDNSDARYVNPSLDELAAAPSVPADQFEARWQQITSSLEVGWINILPAAVYQDTLIVMLEYRPPTGNQPPLPPDRISIPGHPLPP
jgi:hypothetical protein